MKVHLLITASSSVSHLSALHPFIVNPAACLRPHGQVRYIYQGCHRDFTSPKGHFTGSVSQAEEAKECCFYCLGVRKTFSAFFVMRFSILKIIFIFISLSSSSSRTATVNVSIAGQICSQRAQPLVDPAEVSPSKQKRMERNVG